MARFLVAVTLAACAAGCAARQAPPPGPPPDLNPAREALELARAAGADQRAADTYSRAQGHLNEAEALAGAARSVDERRQAEWLGRLAVVEAQCATQLARQQTQQANQRSLASQEVEKHNALMRRHEEDQRRLEEQAALLRRELDLTENEVIRTKARLKGIETKADASSAIAEGRILLGRLVEEKGTRAQDVQRAQEALARAETLLRDENFGAAIFFAQKAQDAALKAREPRAEDDSERPAPSPSYTVKASVANLRRGPSTNEPVVARVSRGTPLRASVMRGEWIRVEHAGNTGWVHRSLLE